MSYLFCNIGWMKDYKGLKKNDKIEGGGSYVDKEEMGYEVCNFAPHKNQMYGYVQPPGGGKMKIERLDADKNDVRIENVNVIWTAKDPNQKNVKPKLLTYIFFRIMVLVAWG